MADDIVIMAIRLLDKFILFKKPHSYLFARVSASKNSLKFIIVAINIDQNP